MKTGVIQYVNGVITIFSGWLQTRGSAGSGMVALEHECSGICNGRADCRVGIFPWGADVEDVAEYRWRFRSENRLQRHIVVGYSYGGQTAVNYCGALIDRGGVELVGLYLCDPVRRWPWAPGLAGLTGRGWLTVPASVQHVSGVCQRRRRWSLTRMFHQGWGRWFVPSGHRVMWRGLPVPLIERAPDHSHIDDDQIFKRDVLKAWAHLVNEGQRV